MQGAREEEERKGRREGERERERERGAKNFFLLRKGVFVCDDAFFTG